MRILFIADNFPPETNAPASRTYEHATRWVSDGAEVTVITGAPNFPQGRVFEGFRNAWRSVEDVDGIRVVRVKTYIADNSGFARRTLDYLSFMFSAMFVGLFEKRPDIVVGTSPQFFAAVGAWMLSVAKWRPFVFELRDLWPASIVTVGAMERGFSIRLLEKLEMFLYRRARMIIPVTQSFKDELVSRGIDSEKIVVVRNGVDLSRYQPQAKSKDMATDLGVAGQFVVAYLGTHGMAHALENVLETARLLESERDICFLLVGDGARKRAVVDQANKMSLSNIIFHDSVPKDQMRSLWSICDIALVHLKDDPVFSTVIPSKIFEAFGMGKPIMIVQPDGEAADIIREAQAGEWIAPENPELLARAISRWHKDEATVRKLGSNALMAAPYHSRDRLAKEMLAALSTLV